MTKFSKSEEEIEIMSHGGQILKATLEALMSHAGVGTSLIELDRIAERLIKEAGALPAFLGYKPYGAGKAFPNSICASVNDTIVHGRPSGYKLKSGDLLKIDIGVLYKGFYTDAARTVGIGEIAPVAKKLINVTKEALNRGISEAVVNNKLGDIGYIIESFVSSRGFKIVRGLTGHGIGKKLHEDPVVNNFGKKNTGLILQAGMVLAIEPMVSVGTSIITMMKDDSYITKDGSLSAHFEDTVVITKNGVRIITR